MTFASYRHLLDLEVQLRHPALGGDKLVRPFGFVASRNEEAVGLALAEAPIDPGMPAQLLSVYVARDSRRRGLGSELVALIEREAAARGFRTLESVFTAGKPGTEWFSRLVSGRGWQPPEPACLVVHLSPSRALSMPALGERALRSFGRGIEVFPWSELSSAEAEEIRCSNEEDCWIEPALEPWRFPTAGLDSSSVGGRYDGRVVGWVLNHRLVPGFVRISCGFIRGDLARNGRMLPLLEAVLRRVAESEPTDQCSFITTFSYPAMIAFIHRRVSEVASFVGESRKAALALR